MPCSDSAQANFTAPGPPQVIPPQVIIANQPSRWGSYPQVVQIWATDLTIPPLTCDTLTGNLGVHKPVGTWTIQPGESITVNLPNFGSFLIEASSGLGYPVNSGFAACPEYNPTKLSVGQDQYSPYIGG